MELLGFSGSYPEILFLPFLFYYKSKFRFTHASSLVWIKYLSIWVLLLLISFIIGRYSTMEILGSSRTYLTLIISFVFFYKWNNLDLDFLMYLALGSIVGWIISSLFYANLYLTGQIETISATGNLLAIPILLSISFFKKHFKVFNISIILLILLSLTSGMRRQAIIFVLTILIIFIILFFISNKEFKRLFKTLLIFILFSVITFSWVSNYLQENIPALYFRVIEKTELFLKGDVESTGDINRIDNIASKLDLTRYLYPHGFVSRQTKGIDDDGGGYIDFPLSELFYTFGFIISFILLVILFTQITFCFKNRKKTNNESLVFFTVGVLLIILFFIEGTFLSSTYVTPITGYCLARIKYYSNIKFVF